MTSLTREVWGREFDLPIYFEDLDDDGISKLQWDAYGYIIVNWSTINDVLPELMNYCNENDSQEAEHVSDNIFKSVIPKSLFIPNTNTCRTVALMCDYRFDPEHGIAIVFENEVLKTIDTQGIIL